MLGKLRAPAALFGRETRGNVAVLFAASATFIFLTVGMATDFGRAMIAKQQLSTAIDSAALALGSSTGLSADEIQERARAYFVANLPPNAITTGDDLEVTANDTEIEMSVSGKVKTTFLELVNFNEFNVKASTKVVKELQNIELVMVLDNTGSMGDNGKLTALKSASRTLVDTLFDATSIAKPDALKIGLVPFAAAVNIGTDKRYSGWVDTGARSSIAWEDFSHGVNVLDLYDDMRNGSWNGCVRARSEPYDTSDTAPDAGNPDTLWAPYFAPDEPDSYSYPNNYTDDGHTSRHDSYDDIQRRTDKYHNLRLSSYSTLGPDFNCDETLEIKPLTTSKSEIKDAIDDMVASGSTVIPAGLSWGWRVISPGEPYTEGKPYDEKDTIKAIVLLTDGLNDVGGGMNNHNRSFYSSYGYAASGHLGATNGYGAEAALNSKTSTLCDNIKAKGIKLYTITFQLSNTSIKNLLRSCATSPDMFYDSPSNGELQTAFASIARSLSNLRIAR